MINNRIAGTAALATFGLAALGGIALAAPGNADTGTSGRSSDSSSHTVGGKHESPALGSTPSVDSMDPSVGSLDKELTFHPSITFWRYRYAKDLNFDPSAY
jgi:hypothetical protein